MKKTRKIARMLDDQFTIKILELPAGKDPNDLGKDFRDVYNH
ncbi:toprim domain-containing protein [Patescibacteria group bacterium]|nr:toprim domain-containing protein [Patescibacteria group bacterium]